MNIKNKFKNSLFPYVLLLLILFLVFVYMFISNAGFIKQKDNFNTNLNFMFMAAETSDTPIYFIYKDKEITLTNESSKKIKYYISQIKNTASRRDTKGDPDAIIAFGDDRIDLYKLNEEESIVILVNDSGQYGIKSSASNTWSYFDSLAKKN